MTESEAIEQFKERLDITDYKEHIPKYYEAMELAIKALEKQIPKKVVYYRYDRRGYYLCPACNHYICDKETAFSRDDTDFSYCDGCGQKLKWRVS